MYRAKPEDGIVWITGASAGIGRALAVRLAGAGYRVAATARRAEPLEDLASTHEQGRIRAYVGDITDGEGMMAIVAAIEKDQGPISLAILNAGAYHPTEREGFDSKRVCATIDTNLLGTIRCLNPILAAMLSRGKGQIAIVASLAGYGGIPGSIAYGAAKAAMINMAEALRLTYAPSGLTIQVVNPGFVETAMTEQNDYPMPFMMSAEVAAKKIQAGLATGGFEITFPRRLAWAVKAAALLPYVLWLPLMSRATRRVRRG